MIRPFSPLSTSRFPKIVSVSFFALYVCLLTHFAYKHLQSFNNHIGKFIWQILHMRLSFLLVFLSVIISSCKKNTESDYDNISGDWDWISSQRIVNRYLYNYVPGNNPTLITFHSFKTFENSSPWTWFSPVQGTYEITNILHNGIDSKILLLKYQQVGTDTLLLRLEGKQMELEMISSTDYQSIHKFTKRWASLYTSLPIESKLFKLVLFPYSAYHFYDIVRQKWSCECW